MSDPYNRNLDEKENPSAEFCDEKMKAWAIQVDNRFVRWVSNFWYHYKWHVIIITFFVTVFLICFAQCSSNEKDDLSVLFAGPKVLSAEEKQGLIDALNDVMPRDFDENGTKMTGFLTFVNYSEQDLQTAYDQALAKLLAEYSQVTDKNREEAESAATSYVNQLRYASNTEYSNYSTSVGAGESAILFVNESLYQTLRDNGRLEPLGNILSNVPEENLDGSAIRIADTFFYQNYDVADILPQGVVVCFLKKPIIGAIHDDSVYNNAKEMFRAIVGGK